MCCVAIQVRECDRHSVRKLGLPGWARGSCCHDLDRGRVCWAYWQCWWTAGELFGGFPWRKHSGGIEGMIGLALKDLLQDGPGIRIHVRKCFKFVLFSSGRCSCSFWRQLLNSSWKSPLRPRNLCSRCWAWLHRWEEQLYFTATFLLTHLRILTNTTNRLT